MGFLGDRTFLFFGTSRKTNTLLCALRASVVQLSPRSLTLDERDEDRVHFPVMSSLTIAEASQGPFVIPAKAGIQSFLAFLDSRLRGSDEWPVHAAQWKNSRTYGKRNIHDLQLL
jgi:hypothetical protein